MSRLDQGLYQSGFAQVATGKHKLTNLIMKDLESLDVLTSLPLIGCKKYPAFAADVGK
jgi:hypothetical protein